MAYKAFESDPELEFEFFLAHELHMTVERLREEMGQDEFVRWGVYFGREAQRREMAQK